MELSRRDNGCFGFNVHWENSRSVIMSIFFQVFIRDCNMLNSWMSTQEPVLRENYFGESIHGVEELLRKHDDFAKTVENQEERLNLVRRLTEVGHFRLGCISLKQHHEVCHGALMLFRFIRRYVRCYR